MIDLSEDARTLLFVFRKGHGPEDPHAFVSIALALSFCWLNLFREPAAPLRRQRWAAGDCASECRILGRLRTDASPTPGAMKTGTWSHGVAQWKRPSALPM